MMTHIIIYSLMAIVINGYTGRRNVSVTKAQPRTTNGKVALITGASGGIGLAAGLALIRAGYRVFGTSRHAKPGESARAFRCSVVT